LPTAKTAAAAHVVAKIVDPGTVSAAKNFAQTLRLAGSSWRLIETDDRATRRRACDQRENQDDARCDETLPAKLEASREVPALTPREPR
jgi:hypothetical protein